ncbi:MAG: ERAP1-like C-terminal domain-containing protein, partial [Janthinobacterium lividum]
YRSIRDRVATETQTEQLKAWIRQQFGPVYASLSPVGPGESLEQARRRAILFNLLGGADDPAAIAEAKRLAVKSLAGDKTGDPEMMRAAVNVAADHGDAAMYDQLQHIAETSTNPTDQTDALFTLSTFTDKALVQRTLDYAVSGKVRNQDSWILLADLLQRPETRVQTWAYIKANWDKVHAQFTTSSGNRVVSATGAFCSVEDRTDVQQFFASHRVDASERALRDAVNAIDSCVKFRGAQQPGLQAWLATAAH